MEGPYKLNKDDPANITVEDSSGALVTEDASSDDYIDFLNFASLQEGFDHAGYCLPTQSYFFNNKKKLVQHFIEFGAHVYIPVPHDPPRDPPRDERKISTSQTLRLGVNEIEFARLAKVEAFRNDSEVEYHGFGGTEKSGFGNIPSDSYVTVGLLAKLNESMRDDKDCARRISSWPIERCFVYLDVSDFSKMPAGHQALTINSIVGIYNRSGYWEPGAAQEAKDDIEAMMCIGDGYIFVLKNPLKAGYFAAYLANLIEVLHANHRLPIEFHFRMGAHFGKVYTFYDPGRKDWNYIGDGINGGQRVLAAVGKETDDVLYISAQLRQKIAAVTKPAPYHGILENAHNRGRKEDKHHRPWRVYEINHTKLMSNFDGYILSAERG